MTIQPVHRNDNMYYVRSDLRPSLCREKLKNNLDKQFIPAHKVCYPPWTSQLRTFAFALPLAWDIPLLGMAWSHSRKYPKAVSNLAVRPSLVSLFTISISLTFTISFVSTYLLYCLSSPPSPLPPPISLSLPQCNTGSTGIWIFLCFAHWTSRSPKQCLT